MLISVCKASRMARTWQLFIHMHNIVSKLDNIKILVQQTEPEIFLFYETFLLNKVKNDYHSLDSHISFTLIGLLRGYHFCE